MKKLTRNVIIIAMAALIVLPSFVYAAPNPFERIEGVDYRRIVSDVPNIPFTLKLGRLEFKGGEIRFGEPLSKDEEDRVIRQVMKEMQINSNELYNAQKLLDFWAAVENVGAGDAGDIVVKLTGLDSWMDLVNGIVDGKKGPADVASDLTGQLGGNIAEEIAKQILGSPASKAKNIWEAIKAGIDKFFKYEDYQDAQKAAADMRAKMAEFYKRCNEALAGEKANNGDGVSIFMNDTVVDKVNFWETVVPVYWDVTMNLEMTSGDITTLLSNSGPCNFEGRMTVLADGAKGLDQRFEYTKFGKSLNAAYDEAQSVQFSPTISHAPLKPTILEKHVDTTAKVSITQNTSYIRTILMPDVTGNFKADEKFQFDYLSTFNAGMEMQGIGSFYLNLTCNWTSNDTTWVDVKADAQGGYDFGTIIDMAPAEGGAADNGDIWGPLDGEKRLEIDKRVMEKFAKQFMS